MAEAGRASRYGRPAIACLAGLAMLLSLLSLNPLSDAAARKAGEVTVGAVTIYAALRTLNLFLSAAQEIEVGGSFIVSGSVQPLKTLEPIDDTIERVAGIILGISVVSGLLSISFGPVAAIGFALLLSGLLLVPRAPPIGRRMAVAGAVLSLVVPVIFVVSGVFADAATRVVWERNAEILEGIAAEIRESEAVTSTLEPEIVDDTEEEGFWSALWRSGTENAEAVSEATSAVVDSLAGYRDASQRLFDEADELLRSYIDILAILLFKLILLPGLLILVALRLIR